jgi:TIR domain
MEAPPDRIFISYSRADGREFAEAFEYRLEHEGIRSWRDLKSMEARKAYWERGNLARKEPPLLDVAQRRRRREQGKPLKPHPADRNVELRFFPQARRNWR